MTIFYDNFYDKFCAFCGNHAAMITQASYEATRGSRRAVIFVLFIAKNSVEFRNLKCVRTLEVAVPGMWSGTALGSLSVSGAG